MSYYPEPDTHIRDKVKVRAKTDFFALKTEIEKLDIIKLTNVLTSLNNLKQKYMIYMLVNPRRFL